MRKDYRIEVTDKSVIVYTTGVAVVIPIEEMREAVK